MLNLPPTDRLLDIPDDCFADAPPIVPQRIIAAEPPPISRNGDSHAEYIPGSEEPDSGEWAESVAKPKSEPLSILTFSQIDAIPVSDDDQIMGDHLLDKGSSLVIAGQGGTGKSRLAFQFVAACRAGHDKFLNFQLHPGAKNMRWLVLQTENSVRRLKLEHGRIKKWLGDGLCLFDDGVFVLAPLHEQDTMLNLDDPDNVLRMRSALELVKPDGVISDPLGDFSVGNLDKDADMRATVVSLSRLTRYKNPSRPLIILHHAGTGQAGAAKATGYDRTSFARNSKVLFNWTRAQINLASMNEDHNGQLAVSCGKCSDGKEFAPFGVTMNEDLIYECDDTLDVAQWSDEVKGRTTVPLIDSHEVAMLCTPAMSKPQLSKAIMEQIGVGRTNAYRYIRAALNEKFIKERDGQLFKM